MKKGTVQVPWNVDKDQFYFCHMTQTVVLIFLMYLLLIYSICHQPCHPCCAQGEHFCEPTTSNLFFFSTVTCSAINLPFLSCVGAQRKTLFPESHTVLGGAGGHGGEPSSGWRRPCCGSCWSAVLFVFVCSQGFRLPGSHWLVILQVRASHSSLSRRLPYTKVCLFPLLFVYRICWRYLRTLESFSIILLHISQLLKICMI